MEPRICKCGCGTAMPETNKWEYVRGHKPKNGSSRKPKERVEEAEAETEAEPEYTDLQMCETQLDAIWAGFTLNQKAHAIVNGANAERD